MIFSNAIPLARFQFADVFMFIDEHLEYPGILEQNNHVLSYAGCLSQRNL